MDIQNAVILITGANRGLGEALAREALARGARKVYAGARDPASVKLAGAEAIRLDVTRPQDVAAAALHCRDVNILINNAGIANMGGFLDPNSEDIARAHLETNYFGVLRVTRAFTGILGANGGGAIVNVLSIASWVCSPPLSTYAASKSAAWAMTNSLRTELRGQNTQVMGLHVGFMDTDMARGFDLPKTAPAVVASRTLDGLQAGAKEVIADEITQMVKQGLSAEPGIYLKPLRE